MIEEMERMPVRALNKRGRGRRRIIPKRLGEVGEATLLPKMLCEGFGVARPWGDSDCYDYILDSGWRRWRTQVKCTAARHSSGGYHVEPIHHLHGKRRILYSADEIDLLVVYIIPCNSWYVFPIATILGVKNLVLYPDGNHPRAKWEHHREAWYFLQEPKACSKEVCPNRNHCLGLKDWRKCYRQAIREDASFLDLTNP